MPKIRTFEAGNLALRPSEVGIEARAAAARRIGATFNQVGGATEQLGHETGQLGVEKERALSQFGARVGSGLASAGDAAVAYQDHQQISHGAAAFAGLSAGLTKQWNDTAKNADPNNPTVGQQFLEGTVEPALQQFRDGFTTENSQKWADAQVAHLRQHMFDKTTADMSTLARQAVVTNHRQTVNALTSTVRDDPSSLDFSLRTLDSTTNAVVGSSPNLTGAAAGAARQELTQTGKEAIIKSAAIGAIEKSGKVPGWISDPKYAPYVNATELKQFEKTAQYYNSISSGETRAQRAQRDYENKNDFNTKINALEAQTMPKNVGDKPSLPDDYWDKLRDLSKHPGAALEPGRLKTMVTNGEVITDRLNKPEPMGAVSHATTMKLLGRIRATDESRLTDNSAIYDAYQRGDLNNADFNFLNREFTNLRSPEGIALEKDRTGFSKSFARLIDGAMNSTGEHSVLGTQRMYEFEMDARRQEQALRQQGKDPHLVYDPRSEYFFGRPENVAKYRISLQEAQAFEKTLKSMDTVRDNGPKMSDKPAFVPPSDWMWSASRRQYRDPSGKIYDASGNAVK